MNRSYCRPLMPLLVFFFLVLSSFGWTQSHQKKKWYKGNTHTHTIHSDGDSTPDEVARWYKEHQYNFLVLSDHNYLTQVKGLNSVFGSEEKFLLIPGEEVSDAFEKIPIHLNGLNINKLVPPQGGSGVVETIQNNVHAIRRVDGVPHINHPNFQWSLTADHIRRVQNVKLIEIFNGHPEVHNLGGGGSPSLETMWDDILSSGKLIYGIAVDDAHHFKGESAPDRSNPGRGWVMVRATELSADRILDAMEEGDFYASTGVVLSDYEVSDKKIRIAIDADSLNYWQEKSSFKYTTFFIGTRGKVLKKSFGTSAHYTLTGEEKYVRARVVNSDGHMAWTQPVFSEKAIRPKGSD